MNASYICPAITLFKNDGTLDLESQAALYENLIKNNIDGVLVEGSIGEFFSVSMEMRKELAEFAVKTINHRIKTIIGTASMIPEEIVPFSNHCLEIGADAVMIISPYYFRFDNDSVFRFYDELIGAIHGPVYLYNFPDRTGYILDSQVVLKLALKHKNLMGIKDTISGMDHTRELINVVKSQVPYFEVYSGFDDNVAHNVLSGGNGVIAGLSNVVPEICAGWVKAMRDNDVEGIAKGQQAINRLMSIYSVGSVFVPIIKEGAKIRGIISSNKCTFPIPDVTEEQTEKVKEILKAEGMF